MESVVRSSVSRGGNWSEEIGDGWGCAVEVCWQDSREFLARRYRVDERAGSGDRGLGRKWRGAWTGEMPTWRLRIPRNIRGNRQCYRNSMDWRTGKRPYIKEISPSSPDPRQWLNAQTWSYSRSVKCETSSQFDPLLNQPCSHHMFFILPMGQFSWHSWLMSFVVRLIWDRRLILALLSLSWPANQSSLGFSTPDVLSG